MPEQTLLDHVRSELIRLEVARDPRVAPTAPGQHPLFLEPRDGAPEPGSKKGVENDPDLIASLFRPLEIPARRQEGFKRTVILDFWLRSAKAPAAWRMDAGIFSALHGTDGGGKMGWTMGGPAGDLYVIESRQVRGLQRLGSDQDGYVFTTGYSFEVYDEILAR